MSSLQELQERRVGECRLLPERALESLEDADAFLHERGLLTLTPSCSLPSLFGATHEEPHDASKRGFARWPKTKWWWGGALAGTAGVYALKIHRGKTLYLTEETARVVDPICRAEIERMENGDPRWALLLGHLSEAGPSLLEDLQVELDLKPRELRAIRSPLERCGVVVSRSVTIPADGGHRHTSELARWDHVYPAPAAGPADLGTLVVAGVRAAVVVPEREPKRWFSWSWRWEEDVLERLVDSGALVRPEPGWLAAATRAGTAS